MEREAFGCGIRFWYRGVKLLEWQEQKLLASGNPVALFAVAQLQALRARLDMRFVCRRKCDWGVYCTVRGIIEIRGDEARGIAL